MKQENQDFTPSELSPAYGRNEPIPRFWDDSENFALDGRCIPVWKMPGNFIKKLILEHNTPMQLATAAAVSSFLAMLPLLYCHVFVIMFVCMRLKLNKVMALCIQNLFMPPFAPFICIQVGYFLLHGTFLKWTGIDTITTQIVLRFWEWLLGSLCLAPFVSSLIWGTVFAITKITQRRLGKKNGNDE